MARSGHTFNKVGEKYVMFGGIDAIKKGDKVGPNNEVFTLKIGKWECTWNPEEAKGDVPLPRT